MRGRLLFLFIVILMGVMGKSAGATAGVYFVGVTQLTSPPGPLSARREGEKCGQVRKSYTFGLLPDTAAQPYSVRGLVSFDVRTYSEGAIRLDFAEEGVSMVDRWFVADAPNQAGIRAYNPVIDRLLMFPMTITACP